MTWLHGGPGPMLIHQLFFLVLVFKLTEQHSKGGAVGEKLFEGYKPRQCLGLQPGSAFLWCSWVEPSD